MNSDKIDGKATEVVGKVEEAAGDLTADRQVEAEGVVDQAKGLAQNAIGKAEDAARAYIGDDVVDQAKGAAERVADQGRQFTDAGRRYVDDQIDNYPNARRAIDKSRTSIADQVRETPILALLLAGTVGFGLCLLINRPGRSDGDYSDL